MLGVVLAACAPTIDGPLELQRKVDLSDGDRLALQLGALPGAVAAHVTIHRAVRDPLAVAPLATSSAAILIVIDDRADRSAVSAAASRLVHAAVPEVGSPEIVIEVGAHRPVLAAVGPFTVEQGSQRPLRAVLGGALIVIAVLAGWIAIRERSRHRR